jgi:hypothetical protein
VCFVNEAGGQPLLSKKNGAGLNICMSNVEKEL